MKINIGQLLSHRANSCPHVEAVVDANSRITYYELNQQVNQLAHWLKEQGIKPGERIAMLCRNSISMLSIFYAAAKIGAIVLPLNGRLNPEEFFSILNETEPMILFYDEGYQEIAERFKKMRYLQMLVQIGNAETSNHQFHIILADQPTTEPEIMASGDDEFLLIYTSGTTGRAKGVILSHNNLWMIGYTTSNHYDWRYKDRNLVMTPMFHISGCVCFIINCMKGATIIYIEFHPSIVWQVIEQERITQFFAVPAMIKLMMNEPNWMDRNIDSLRYIICAADTVPPQIIQKCNSYGIDILHAYGSTEYTGLCTSWVTGMDPEKRYTVGKALPFAEVKVLNPLTGEKLPAGEIGEIVYRGPQLFQGYWRNPTETDLALRNGWYHSGDMGKIDEEGYLVIVDRYKDLIICGGSNIYPAEVEGILLNLDGIHEVAVVGAPDEILGQVPMTFVVKRPHSSLTKEDILEFGRRHLATYKCGKEIEFIDALPRNANGKVLKTKLRELAKQIMEGRQSEERD